MYVWLYVCIDTLTYIQLHSGKPNESQIFCKSEFNTQLVNSRYVSKGVQLKSYLSTLQPDWPQHGRPAACFITRLYISETYN